MPDFELPPRPPVPPEILSELEQASWEDPDPLPKCVGVTKRGVRCERDVYKGIGSAHCHDHFSAEERRRRDLLEAARARMRDVEEQAVLDQRQLQAEWWVDRYGRLPSRLEMPSAPALTGEADPDCPEIPSSTEFRRMAIRYLHATGWPDITPRAAEIIRTLADLEYASPQVIAEHALAQAPGRWATAEEWLDSSIWDGYEPPLEQLPPAGTVPEFDEYPGVRELRRRMEREASGLRRWKDGFEALMAACACEPVATVRDLLAFWLDIDVLEEACDADAGGTRLCVEMSPTSPWMAVRLRSQGGDRQIFDRALQFLVRSGVPWDPDTMHVAPGDPDVPPHEPADVPPA
jgi:hypothetical protein